MGPKQAPDLGNHNFEWKSSTIILLIKFYKVVEFLHDIMSV